jgi:membrane-bound serine protease (ClpP class)
LSEVSILVLLFVIGVLTLVAEIFIPSHGVLSLAGLGFLAAAVYKTFTYAGREAGIIAVFACLVFIPAFAFMAIKYWHRTPIGRRIAPPNPSLTEKDTTVPVEALTQLIGQTGRTQTPLRPVGICDFGGRRVSCIAEFDMIEAGVEVEGTRISGANLAVQPKKAEA